MHASACLAQTICAVKERIRWQTPAWTPSQCRRIADAVATSAKRHDLSPTLLLAIMVNESDMNEKAARIYTRDGKVYAKDGGLMAIRCLLDDHDRCTNGNVRGVAWKDLMDPVTNIELGARELAHWRDGGGVMTKTIVKLDASGHRQRVTKDVPCDHKTHGWWAHYNHGPRYIDKGYRAALSASDRGARSRVRDGDEHAGARADGRTHHHPRSRQARAHRRSSARAALQEALRADPLRRDLLGARAELKRPLPSAPGRPLPTASGSRGRGRPRPGGRRTCGCRLTRRPNAVARPSTASASAHRGAPGAIR